MTQEEYFNQVFKQVQFSLNCQYLDEKFGECWEKDTIIDDIVSASGEKYRIRSFYSVEHGYETLVYWYNKEYKSYERVHDFDGFDVYHSLEAMQNCHKAMVEHWKKK